MPQKSTKFFQFGLYDINYGANNAKPRGENLRNIEKGISLASEALLVCNILFALKHKNSLKKWIVIADCLFRKSNNYRVSHSWTPSFRVMANEFLYG